MYVFTWRHRQPTTFPNYQDPLYPSAAAGSWILNRIHFGFSSSLRYPLRHSWLPEHPSSEDPLAALITSALVVLIPSFIPPNEMLAPRVCFQRALATSFDTAPSSVALEQITTLMIWRVGLSGHPPTRIPIPPDKERESWLFKTFHKVWTTSFQRPNPSNSSSLVMQGWVGENFYNCPKMLENHEEIKVDHIKVTISKPLTLPNLTIT